MKCQICPGWPPGGTRASNSGVCPPVRTVITRSRPRFIGTTPFSVKIRVAGLFGDFPGDLPGDFGGGGGGDASYSAMVLPALWVRIDLRMSAELFMAAPRARSVPHAAHPHPPPHGGTLSDRRSAHSRCGQLQRIAVAADPCHRHLRALRSLCSLASDKQLQLERTSLLSISIIK